MKYFTVNSERKGTCYHEFYKGKWDGATFWKEDSIFLHDDILYSCSGFANVLTLIIPRYDPYGETEVSAADWEKIGKAIRQNDRSSVEFRVGGGCFQNGGMLHNSGNMINTNDIMQYRTEIVRSAYRKSLLSV